MKNLIKTFFFGYLPLGWKRLFRAITFSWVAVLVLDFIDIKRYAEDNILWTILVIGVSINLSYVISGFIKQKKV
jgi:hypothetical protein